MRIVELSDYTMVIMKDSDDSFWNNIGDIYRKAKSLDVTLAVDVDQVTFHYLESSDYIYSAGRLMLFFKDKIPDRFHLHDKVVVFIPVV